MPQILRLIFYLFPFDTSCTERLIIFLPTGLAAMGVTPDVFDDVIKGAMADHCHKTNPRVATPEQYREMLHQSL